MNEHELGFTAFLAEPSQRRFRTLLELGPKRWKDVTALLDHSIELDARYYHHLTGSDASPAAVGRLLRSLGAPHSCFVISSDARIDGKELSLGQAIDAVSAGFFGAFLSCIPGRLGYFGYEDMKSAYLLRR